jgi:IS30 family transposase
MRWGESTRAIARRLARHPSTVSRELARSSDRGGYRATQAYERATRPKPAKLHTNLKLRRLEEDLQRCYSPEQIVGRSRRQVLTIRRCECLPKRSTSPLGFDRGAEDAAATRTDVCPVAERPRQPLGGVP